MYKPKVNLKFQWLDSIKNLLPEINKLHNRSSDLNVEPFTRLVSSLLNNKGHTKAISILKSYRVAVQQLALKQEVVPVPFHKCGTDKVPRAIKFLVPCKDNRDEWMYSLSVLRLIDEFKCEPSYDVSTITSPSDADPRILQEIEDFITNTPDLMRVLPELSEEPNMIISNKAGPNGPASITALKDLNALVHKDIKLFNTVNKRLHRLESAVLPADYIEHVEVDENRLTSKLVFLSDKACKTRLIAIGDWWSNIAISNLHKAFMTGLERLSSDVAYRQDKIPEIIHSFGNELYSSDMTAFTDRFPIQLEYHTIKVAYGSVEADEWKHIMVGRKYYHPKVGEIVYACGNPMGLLSSWAVSSFTHHIVKMFCAFKVKGDHNFYKKKYLILGDDTIDTNKEVYDKYTEVIRSLGVSINPSKCTVSKSGYAEFAKRFFTPEGEITGLPVHLLTGLKRSPEQLLELVRLCRLRGYLDGDLRPGVLRLVDKYDLHHKYLLICILSLPENVTGHVPFLRREHFTAADHIILPFLQKGEMTRDPSPITLSNYFDAIDELDEKRASQLIVIARDRLFWEITSSFVKPKTKRKEKYRTSAEVIEISNTHPLWATLYTHADVLQPEAAWISKDAEGNEVYLDKPDEYYIYNQWMEGNYRELGIIPDIDVYKYYSKGHYVTKCKFDTQSLVVRLLLGDCNIPLFKCTKYKDKDLYRLTLVRIIPDLGDLTEAECLGPIEGVEENQNVP